MAKSLISVIIVAAMFTAGAIFEQVYLKRTFSDLKTHFTSIYEKLEDETATEEDAEKIQDYWISKKRTLHSFISHNDLKEFDLWIAEAVAYVKLNDYKEAKTKIEVAIELTEQIPMGYFPRFENIF